MIPLFKTNIHPSAGDRVREVLQSGFIGEGKLVEEFTEKLSELWNQKNVVCTNSCTSALEIALRLAGVSVGDSVVTSPFTFPATNCVVKQLGADILWGKIDRTLCLDLFSCRSLLTKCRAIIITLVGGNVPLNLEEFLEDARRNHVAVIFDAAHALLTAYRDSHISHWADYSCFSFQSIKHLTTGDGGALVCRNEWDHERAKKLKWFGISRETRGKTKLEHQMSFSIPEWGYKAHLNDIAAAIGLSNFELAIEAVRKSRENADSYMRELNSIEVPEGVLPSWWVYPVTTHSSMKVCSELAEVGIEASPLWMINNKHSTFPSDAYVSQPNIVCIPNGFWINEEERNYITKHVRRICPHI